MTENGDVSTKIHQACTQTRSGGNFFGHDWFKDFDDVPEPWFMAGGQLETQPENHTITQRDQQIWQSNMAMEYTYGIWDTLFWELVVSSTMLHCCRFIRFPLLKATDRQFHIANDRFKQSSSNKQACGLMFILSRKGNGSCLPVQSCIQLFLNFLFYTFQISWF